MAMIEKDIKQNKVAEELNISPQTLYNTFQNDNMTLKRAGAIADILDCDIVLQDRKTGKVY